MTEDIIKALTNIIRIPLRCYTSHDNCYLVDEDKSSKTPPDILEFSNDLQKYPYLFDELEKTHRPALHVLKTDVLNTTILFSDIAFPNPNMDHDNVVFVKIKTDNWYCIFVTNDMVTRDYTKIIRILEYDNSLKEEIIRDAILLKLSLSQ